MNLKYDPGNPLPVGVELDEAEWAQFVKVMAGPQESTEAIKRAAAHASDCAVHNAPALPPGPCDCK